MPRPFASKIHQWAENADGKNTALMTNSPKHTFNNDAGIAFGSGSVGADTGEAMRSPFRAPHALARRARSINRTDSVEEILSFKPALAGFSRRGAPVMRQRHRAAIATALRGASATCTAPPQA